MEVEACQTGKELRKMEDSYCSKYELLAIKYYVLSGTIFLFM